MSQASSQPPVPLKTELETVVCWPLIYAAGGAIGLALTVVVGLATFSALTPPPNPEQAVVPMRQAPIQPEVALVAPPSLPAPVEGPRPAPTPVVQTPAPRRPLPPPAPPSVPLLVAVPPPSAPPPPVARADKEPPVAPRRTYQRRSMLSEVDLRALLARVPELDLDSEKGTVKKLLAKPAEDDKRAVAHPIRGVVAARADLRGLPLRDDVDCLTEKAAALNLDRLSRSFRALDARRARERELLTRTRSSTRAPATPEPDSHALAERHYLEEASDQKLVYALQSSKGWQEKKAVGPLMQMLQADSLFVRRHLVNTLAWTKGRSATEALARLAVFDLSPTVREDALAALQKRPVADARPVFVSALRYPWAPAANNAAEALVTLNDRKAVAALEPLLAEPDPSAPFVNEDRKLVVKELVRVNHLRNCLLCHAASWSRTDRVRGFVPTPGEAIPLVYYAARKGNFVRAEVTYLKQDFSTMQPVADAAPWPEMQRYDYLLRTRELSAGERVEWSVRTARALAIRPPPRASYPQKEAVLFALHYLKAKEPRKAYVDD